MQISRIGHYMCAIALCVFAGTVAAKEVTLQHMGLTLNADLQLAADKNPSDGVVLITHGALAHRDMEFLVYLRHLLKERGYSTLSSQ